MTFERSNDWELIRGIMTHPAIYPHISDDGSPAAEDYRPAESELLSYFLVYDGPRLLGLFVIVPQTYVCGEVHTCLLPHAWGDLAAAAARGMAEYLFTHTHVERIVTSVPAYNRLALRFAKAAGMTEYGLNPRAHLKRGKLHDVHLLGMSKTEKN